MKKFFLFLAGITFLQLTTYAQAPQAVCYQAAAKDNQGVDLVGQDISIRAAVVKNNPSGTVEWEEIHSPTTDQFGLFTINIGEGAATGNGAQTDFSLINWGDGDYWLRIEMDASGGMDFELMGATKIISVPYALYANGAQRAETADLANIANLANVANTANFADSANVANTALTAVQAQTALVAETALDDLDKNPTNELQELSFNNCILSISNGNEVDLRAGIFGMPGASSDFPQGILGEHIVLLDQLYTVPDGKNLYLTASGPMMQLKTPAGDIEHPTTPNMPVLPPGTQIEECFCTGILIDTHSDVEAVIIDLNDPVGYDVPAGKTLFVKSGIPNALPGMLVVSDQEMEFFRPNLTRGSHIITLPENINIKKPALYAELYLTGYLVSN